MESAIGSDDRQLNVVRVGGKYRLGEQIGSGSFGTVYSGVNVISNEAIAVKLESVQAEHLQLEHEYRVYKSTGGIGIPSIRWFGMEGDCNALVLTLLGPSLEDTFNRSNRKFSLTGVLILADQMISCIEHIHSCHFIHGDIKPANFLMGVGEHDHEVYLIDFGLAKRFRDPKTHLHIPCKEHCPPTGTVPYVSINNHLGLERSRRDDIESLAYILIYFLCGSLPWHGIRATTSGQEHQTILQLKMNLTLDRLYPACPSVFGVFLDYACGLAFDEKLDYDYLRSLFRKLLITEEQQYRHPFAKCIMSNSLCDWTFGSRGETSR
ncbi:hypothetical protein PILCRDRAFT_76040 [Piloderma croceum F 1598]|uniref:non-specific serine/threonine protein kinase n=1 Tax=Piloderma croceum (strain F 1598) TaxID=765440 RepID=A0A0C3F026_PILCF|nr:hypothetical protein PILCRDRAFT_76040 [Piloderma croceum F 1598]